jgi:hypothetical protein
MGEAGDREGENQVSCEHRLLLAEISDLFTGCHDNTAFDAFAEYWAGWNRQSNRSRKKKIDEEFAQKHGPNIQTIG